MAMKIWWVRFFAFVSTLGIGLAFFWFFLPKPIEVNQERFEYDLGKPVASVPDRKDSDFVPEFSDLPSLDDFYVYRKPQGRLLHFLEGGVFRQSEVVANDGETWLVLEDINKTLALKRTTARVRKLKSSSLPGNELDAKLSFKSVANPILALHHYNAIKPGPVESLFGNGVDGEEMAEGYFREFAMGEGRFRLRTSMGLTKDNEQLAVLLLESGDIKQVIEQTVSFAPPERNIIGSLLWAGDLDADGELDLYFDEFNEKGYTHTKLFLSSLAGPGELVGFFGSFGAAGC